MSLSRNCIVLSLVISQILIKLSAQKEDYQWMLGSPDGSFNMQYRFGGMDLDFNDGSVKLLIHHKPFYMSEHNASICDTNGRLLIYTDGCYLTDRLDRKIVGGDTLNPIEDYYENCVKEGKLYPTGLELPQGGIILPLTQDKSGLIYLSVETIIGTKFLYSPHVLATWIQYDRLNDTFYVMNKNTPIVRDTFPTGGMIAIEKYNKNGYWVIIRKNRSNVIYTLDISQDTIQWKKKSIGEYYQYGSLGVAAFSPNGKTYGFYCKNYDLELMDFDRNTGELSNYRKIEVLDTTTGIGGICFSPDSKKLYVSTYENLYQYDMESSDLKSSEVLIDHVNNVTCDPAFKRKTRFGPMVIGPDCRIYMVSNYQQTCMNIIMNPNEYGRSCNFIQQGIRFPHLNHGSIPNFPHFRIDETYPCDSTIRWDLSEVHDWNFSTNITIFPNPVESNLNVVFPNPILSETYIKLINIEGSIVHFEKIIPGETNINIDCSRLPSGIYLFQLRSDNGSWGGGKFIKL
ncbi:MAG: T9SS type A sorting domain-containing protein [Saprospiraceae bacterium]|nr:T9SS type A sorting domain-containing protein [Saprospiraceae bacterium]